MPERRGPRSRECVSLPMRNLRRSLETGRHGGRHGLSRPFSGWDTTRTLGLNTVVARTSTHSVPPRQPMSARPPSRLRRRRRGARRHGGSGSRLRARDRARATGAGSRARARALEHGDGNGGIGAPGMEGLTGSSSRPRKPASSSTRRRRARWSSCRPDRADFPYYSTNSRHWPSRSAGWRDSSARCRSRAFRRGPHPRAGQGEWLHP